MRERAPGFCLRAGRVSARCDSGPGSARKPPGARVGPSTERALRCGSVGTVLEIERVSWRKPRYAVSDNDGHGAAWMRRRFRETMTGEIDGEPYELRRDGRRRFTLVSRGTELARAEAARRGRWTILVEGSTYELRRRSTWRSAMDLRSGASTVGSIRKGRAPRGRVLCELPAELSPAVQAFIGFVVLLLWDRVAASSGAAAVAASG
jgi:hypothetical protein